MGRLFGTDGVRGVANIELTADIAYELGRAGAYVLTKQMNHTPRILVAIDTRISGEMLESALIAGICSVGATAIPIGVMPTPGASYLVRKHELDAGVVISASHNPMEYNGIKFFNSEGYKLRDELENEIEDYIFLPEKKSEIPSPVGKDIGVKDELENMLEDYISFLAATSEVGEGKLGGIKVALDCANGAAYKTAPLALYRLGAEVNVINNEPDGTNINENCGSTHMEELVRHVKEIGADVGFAFDGDADRCLAVDENGDLVEGDQIIAVCGNYMKQQNKLVSNTIVATVMSNLGLHMMGREQGIDIIQTAVGDRYVLEEMLKNGYNLGGEASGHVIFLDYNPTGDGVLTAIQLLSVMKATGKKLSELTKVMEVLPQVLVNARVSNERKYGYEADEEISAEIRRINEQFGQDGRVLIRTSGTEPLIRIMIEGKNQAEMEQAAIALAHLMEEKLKA